MQSSTSSMSPSRCDVALLCLLARIWHNGLAPQPALEIYATRPMSRGPLGWGVQGTVRPSGQDELQPEGNGTGFLWDDAGNVVTNYHVLQSALAAMSRRPGAQRAGQGGQVVAKITLLGI